jgi:DeoR family myo-inositol catabolism operon transcriptional repressor
MRTKRIDEIEKYIRKEKSVSIDTLCRKFDVSKNTIRRDIDSLAKSGIIQKVYGGITLADRSISKGLLPFTDRQSRFSEAKHSIAQTAAGYVRENDVIFIDTGTTCHNLIDSLSDISCTVITNSLLTAGKALSYENIRLISLPGHLQRKTFSFVDEKAGEFLKDYNISKAFMACTGLSIRQGLTNASKEEYLIKKAVIENSVQCFALADHSKFDSFSLMTYCPLERIDYLITDQTPSDDYISFCQDHHITLNVTMTDKADSSFL